MKRAALGFLIVSIWCAVAAAMLHAPAVAAAGSPVTVTVDRNVQVGTSQLSLGVTHTQQTVIGGDPTATAGARSLLKQAVSYQNVFIYGWGSTNPEPSPGVFDWTSLDHRIAMIRAMSATPIISLCCAPDWMTALGTNTSTYCNGSYNGCLPPAPAHYHDFADLARRIALRYPDVTHYVVWNEMKGLYQGAANQWDLVSYTAMYNAVYDALKAVNPRIQVGGPYLTIQGTGTNTGPWYTWAPVTRPNVQALEYFLQYAHGVDFVALDRNVHDYHDPTNYTDAEKLALTHYFGDVVTQVRSLTNLPIWYSEPHFAGHQAGGLLFQGAGNASMLLHDVQAGAAASLNWEPEPQANPIIDDCLYTSTHQAGGGQPFPTYYSYRAIHDYFPPGTALYQSTSSSPDVEVLASATHTLLINKTPGSLPVTVNGTVITLGKYEVRVLDQNGKTIRYASNPPVIVSPPDNAVVPSSFTVTGGAEPLGTVKVFDGSSLIGTTSPASNGAFSLPVSGLSAGTHTLTATVTGPYRTQSPASTSVTVTVSANVLAIPPRNPAPTVSARLAAFGGPPLAPIARRAAPKTAAEAASSTPVWARQFGTVFDDRAAATAADSTGIYVAGLTYGSLAGQRHTGRGANAFVSKYDSAGNALWTREFGTVGNNAITGVAAAGSAVYVGGSTDTGAPGLASFGAWDGFIRKYDQNGNTLWTREVGTAGDDVVNAVAADSSGVYVAGVTDGTFPGATNAGHEDAFLQKYDTNGNLLWTQQFGTANQDVADGVAVDSTGVYVAGSTAGSLDGTAAGMLDGFVRKYSLTGTLQWGNQFGTPLNDETYGVATDSTGVYLVGYAEGSLGGAAFPGGDAGFIQKYSAGGALMWAHELGSGSETRFTAVAADPSGVYVTGWTRGALPGQVSGGNVDTLVQAYTPAGTVAWTRQWGGTGDDLASSVATDANAVYTVGITNGTLPGQTASGGWDAWVARWSKTP
jgi:hypothetical protein